MTTDHPTTPEQDARVRELFERACGAQRKSATACAHERIEHSDRAEHSRQVLGKHPDVGPRAAAHAKTRAPIGVVEDLE